MLEDSAPDGPLTLPKAPTQPLPSGRAPDLHGDSFLDALPPVPDSTFGITDEELDRELKRLSIADTGLSFTVAQPVCRCYVGLTAVRVFDCGQC